MEGAAGLRSILKGNEGASMVERSVYSLHLTELGGLWFSGPEERIYRLAFAHKKFNWPRSDGLAICIGNEWMRIW